MLFGEIQKKIWRWTADCEGMKILYDFPLDFPLLESAFQRWESLAASKGCLYVFMSRTIFSSSETDLIECGWTFETAEVKKILSAVNSLKVQENKKN